MERADLAARLNESDDLLICTILTAAGYGKTTALIQYQENAKAQDKVVAWISLDESDRDTLNFLESIFQSFELVHENSGKAALAILRDGGVKSARAALISLFDGVAELPQGGVLILDDYHVVENGDINEIIRILLDLASDNFSLKVASRFVPDIDLSVYKVRGQVTEFRTQDLQFGQRDSLIFLEEFTKTSISAEHFSAISDYAGGWAIGLQVAAISIKQMGSTARFLDRFSKSKSDVSDFLASDVIAGLDEPVKKFLSDTAHLRILNAELCDAVIGSTNSYQMLEKLERLNLFIEPVGNEEGWYRYHGFFQDFLRERFVRHDFDYIREINRRSYIWFSEKGMYDHSIFHALNAEMWPEAADGLEASWKQMVIFSQLDRLRNWLTRLPVEVLSAKPILQIAHAWTEILQRDVTSTKALITELQSKSNLEYSALEYPKNQTDPIMIDLFVLQAATHNVCDDVAEIAPLADIDYANLHHLDPFQRGILMNCIAYAYVITGQFDKAHRLAERALKVHHDSGLILAAIHGELFRGFAFQICGDLNAAHQAFISAHTLAMRNFNYPYSPPQSLLASIYYEWDKISEATNAIDQSANAISGPSILGPVIDYYVTAAKIAFLNQQVSKAFSILAEAEVIGEKNGNSRLLIAVLTERIRFHLTKGNLDEAKDIERELIELAKDHRKLDHFIWPRTQSLVAQASAAIKIAERKPQKARDIVSPYIVEAQASGRDGLAIKFLILDALALNQMNKANEANKRLSQALNVGQKGNYIRLFADQLSGEPELVAGSLNRAMLNGLDQTYLTDLSSAIKIPLQEWIKQPEYHTEGFSAEALTQREKELLHMLSRGKANKQIARELEISSNTVAWHLKNLFVKLNVKNRTEAADMARQTGLIS